MNVSMETISTKLPDDEAEEFEQIVLAKRLLGEDVSKSTVVRDLIREWVDDHREVLDNIEFDSGGKQ